MAKKIAVLPKDRADGLSAVDESLRPMRPPTLSDPDGPFRAPGDGRRELPYLFRRSS